MGALLFRHLLVAGVPKCRPLFQCTAEILIFMSDKDSDINKNDLPAEILYKRRRYF